MKSNHHKQVASNGGTFDARTIFLFLILLDLIGEGCLNDKCFPGGT
jgi:hypothetical protein